MEHFSLQVARFFILKLIFRMQLMADVADFLCFRVHVLWFRSNFLFQPVKLFTLFSLDVDLK